MIERLRRLVSGVTVALTLALASLSVNDGGRSVQRNAGSPRPAGEDEPERDDEQRGPSGPEKWSETFGAVLGRTLRKLGDRGAVVRERIEGFVGVYKLLRAMGMSDQQIATLIAEQTATVLGRGLSERTPTAGDTRRVVDAVQDTVIHAAQDVDVRLGLGGDFVRRVREGVQATREGREDAIAAVERTMEAAQEQLRRLLSKKDEGEKP